MRLLISTTTRRELTWEWNSIKAHVGGRRMNCSVSSCTRPDQFITTRSTLSDWNRAQSHQYIGYLTTFPDSTELRVNTGLDSRWINIITTFYGESPSYSSVDRRWRQGCSRFICIISWYMSPTAVGDTCCMPPHWSLSLQGCMWTPGYTSFNLVYS